MRFFETILSAAAFVAAVAALEINDFPAEGVVAGQTYTITYSPADNTPTTFILRQGQSTDLDTIATLTTTATGGKFEWTVEESLPNEPDYALQIQQGTTINYSAQFPLTGGSEEDDSVSSALSSASSATSSAASSASSALSSAKSSMITSAPASASATISPSAGVNSTVTSATLSRSRTTSGSATGSASLPEVTDSGANLIGSPVAAMLGAAAAFAYFA
jgi:transglutaminase/protease-like cytokinesis protein 3